MAGVDGILTAKQTRTILTAIRAAVNSGSEMDVLKGKQITTQMPSII